MDIAISQEQATVPVTVFHIKGNIDVTSYQQLQAQAQQAIDAGTRYLLLDLSQVGYISSAGLRAIHLIFNLLRTDSPDESARAVSWGLRDGTFKSPHLKLLNPSPGVRQVLTTTGFDMFLEIHDNLEEAVASF
jgi:anti-anti-sigma regulatory factor